jgi:glutamate-1-semialdehyde 2,1-aminomutase
MALKREKNAELTKKFNALYPGGHTNFKVPIVATNMRLFLERGEGSRVWDVDGNEFIDYMGALGPNILGHRHPAYINALREYMDTRSLCVGSGLLFSPDDIDVAEKLVTHIPCAEQVKLCVSGSEAVQMAFRLARAYTGRPYFLRFGGHYHGWFDNILGGEPDPNPQGKPFALQGQEGDICATEGKYPGANEQGLMIPWNDVDALEETLRKYAEEIAIIHFEAIVVNHNCQLPRPGYLEKVRALCDQYGIVMSMDEVITGFRVGLSGAQGMLGVTPDIATFGKALGGGMPISCVVGKSDIMSQMKDSKVLGPGTFNGNPFCMRAVKSTLEILERDNGAIYPQMERIQKRLMNGLDEIARRRNITMRIQGTTGVFYTLFGVDPDTEQYTDADCPAYDFETIVRFWMNMAEEGVLILAGGRWYPTIMHSEADVDKTLEAADRAMANL